MTISGQAQRVFSRGMVSFMAAAVLPVAIATPQAPAPLNLRLPDDYSRYTDIFRYHTAESPPPHADSALRSAAEDVPAPWVVPHKDRVAQPAAAAVEIIPHHASQAQINDARARRRGDYTNQYGERCRLKDRFDRTSVISFQFGNGVGVGIERGSLRMGSHRPQETRVMVTWRIGAQTKGERCRVQAPVQGLVGSVYNEIFLREKEQSLAEPLGELSRRIGLGPYPAVTPEPGREP